MHSFNDSSMAIDEDEEFDLTRLQATGLMPWVVCFVASLFFFYEFIQMNMFNAINVAIMHDFSLNASQLGLLSSIYFWANVVFLFPAGMILDRFSPRIVVLISLSICVLGTYLFSQVHSVSIAAACRFLTGIGSAFCFLSCVRLATRWFPANRIALITGLIVTMAMIGGFVAQAPLTYLVEKFGWRYSLTLDAALGLIILALIFSFVKDYPAHVTEENRSKVKKSLQDMGFWQTFKVGFLTPGNWLCGFYTCLLNLPLFILGGFLGSTYLQVAHNISHTQASFIASMIFAGTIIGSPFMGWISDRIGLRRPPMLVGAVLSIFVILAIMFLHQVSITTLFLLFFALGFITSTQVISYPVVAESHSPLLTATCVSVVSFTTIGGGAVFEPIFGRLMDWHAKGLLDQAGVPVYSVADYQFAMWLFPIGFAISFLAAWRLHETYCRNPQMTP